MYADFAEARPDLLAAVIIWGRRLERLENFAAQGSAGVEPMKTPRQLRTMHAQAYSHEPRPYLMSALGPDLVCRGKSFYNHVSAEE